MQSRAAVPFSYDDSGGNGPPLVLVHGFPLDRTIWSAQSASLAPIARIIAVDLPGCGATPARPQAASIDELADDLAATLDGLSIERAAVAGHSLGGYIALAFARRHAAHLAGLALVGSHFAPDTAEIRASRAPLAARVEAGGMAAAVESYLPRYFAPRVYDERPELVARAQAIMESLEPAAAAMLVRAMGERSDGRAAPAALAVPLLVVSGALDSYIRPADLRAAAADAAEAIVVILDGVGHMPMMEDAVRTSEALAAWLGRIRA